MNKYDNIMIGNKTTEQIKAESVINQIDEIIMIKCYYCGKEIKEGDTYAVVWDKIKATDAGIGLTSVEPRKQKVFCGEHSDMKGETIDLGIINSYMPKE